MENSGISSTSTASHPHKEDEDDSKESPADEPLERTRTRHFGPLKFRPHDDDDDQDWWFASIVCPLLAATIGPLANVLSIAARVTFWRAHTIVEGNPEPLPQLYAIPYQDPEVLLDINTVSLVFGYVGNLFLLANFTNRIRYDIALPVTVLLWALGAGLLVGALAGMVVYHPAGENDVYTQGFWYGVIAAVLYGFSMVVLLINMLGYWMGHYPAHFNLTDAQRTLILQTFIFFIWMAGGAGVFVATERHGDQWLFTDALYFCDVTILTVGFGDLTPSNNVTRGLVLPFAIGGIIMLGLVISSISTFATDISKENVEKRRIESRRARTVERSIASTSRRRSSAMSRRAEKVRNASITSAHPIHQLPPDAAAAKSRDAKDTPNGTNPVMKTLARTGTLIFQATPFPAAARAARRKPRALILREEKDRFNAMRKIQSDMSAWKGWTALTMSISAFAALWLVGAAVFYAAERHGTGPMTYFEALYFCYISLLTIGYGDFSPKTNAGRPFFVVWSLLAVPTMTILVSSMGATVVKSFKTGTEIVADFTLLPKHGVYREFVKKKSWLAFLDFERRKEITAMRKRLEEGFPVGPTEDEVEEPERPPTLDELARRGDVGDWELGKHLAATIRRVAKECKHEGGEAKKYTYEEWVEFTELIRFTSWERRRRRRERHGREKMHGADDGDHESEDEDGLIEWDWIGENSPMMQEQSEPEFVLERLTESMARFVRQQSKVHGRGELGVIKRRIREAQEDERRESTG